MSRPLLLILACLLAAVPAYARGPEGHGERGEAQPGTPNPATLAGVVASMRAQHAVAGRALKAGNADQVFARTQALWDLADADPAKGAALSPDARTTIAAKSLDVQQQTNSLVAKFLKGDQSGAKVAVEAVGADIDALALLAK